MVQPIRKRKSVEIKPKMAGIEYCNDCPFLGYDFEKGEYMCNPNVWMFGKTNDKILLLSVFIAPRKSSCQT